MLLFDDGKKLEKVVGEEAAQIIVSMFERMSEEQKKELATKGDLREESNAIRADVRETELRLQKEIKDVEYRLLKWQLGIGFAIILTGQGFWLAGFLIRHLSPISKWLRRQGFAGLRA